MAELTINTADIAAALSKNLEGFTPERRGRAGRPRHRGRRRHRPRLGPARASASTSCSSSRAAPSASP